MINATINQLVDRLKAFADGHFYIKSFVNGEITDEDLSKNMQYPIMRIDYTGVQPSPGQNSYNFSVWFVDLPRRKAGKLQNIQEIHSDMTLLALDLLKELRNGQILFGSDVDVQDGVNIVPFTDENHNFVSGVTMDITILVNDTWNACIIPADFATGGTGYPSESLRTFALPIYDEGNFIVDAYNINFVGSGVTVTYSGNRAIVTITGGGGGGGITCDDLPTCATIQTIVSDINALESAVNAAETDISNLTTGKENTGVAATLLANHVAAPDPHPQYLLEANLPSSLPPNGDAGGDLDGTYPNPTVSKVHSIDFQNGTPSNNQVWMYETTNNRWKHHTLVKSDVGLGNVDNTSDANKPISTATQTALDAKENSITAGTTAQYYRGDKTFQTLNATAVANDSGVSGSTVKDALNTLNSRIKRYINVTDSSAFTGSTGEQLVRSQLIPGGTFTVTDIIRIRSRFRKTGTAGISTQRIYLNTSSSLSGALLVGQYVTGAANHLYWQMKREVVIKSSTVTECSPNSISANVDDATLAGAVSNLNVNWANDVYVIFSVQNANSGDTTIQSYYNIDGDIDTL